MIYTKIFLGEKNPKNEIYLALSYYTRSVMVLNRNLVGNKCRAAFQFGYRIASKEITPPTVLFEKFKALIFKETYIREFLKKMVRSLNKTLFTNFYLFLRGNKDWKRNIQKDSFLIVVFFHFTPKYFKIQRVKTRIRDQELLQYV